MKKKAFTLAEILIVLVLFGLLAGIILQTYTTISQVSFRMHQEKQIAKEALLLSQVLENLAQDHTIDYDHYKNREEIEEKNWIVDTLYLKRGENEKIQLSSTCWGSNENEKNISAAGFMEVQNSRPEALADEDYQALLEKIKKAECSLTMIKTIENENTKTPSEEITLLDTQNFLFTKPQFKIIPFVWIEDTKTAFSNGTIEKLPPLAQPGFQISGILYSKFYHPHKRSNNIALPIQLFFTLGGNLPSLYETNDANNENPQ